MYSALELKVIATLAYSNQFDYPLDETEILHRLVSTSVLVGEGWSGPVRSETISLTKIRETLKELLQLGVVISNGTYWALSGIEKSFRSRISRTRQTQQKQAAIVLLSQMLHRIPGVEGFAITGSVAVQNATATDDIDVLVITKPHHLWLTRFLVLIMTIATGHRVRLHQTVGNAWCFNLWLESDHLAVPKSKRTLYEAYEVLQAKFIWAKPGIRREWLAANAWVAEFVATQYYHQWAIVKNEELPEDLKSSWWQYPVVLGLEVLNSWLYWLQTAYRWLRYKEAPRALEVAFFHEPTTKKIIYSQWRQLVEKALHMSRAKPMRMNLMKRK
jgi:predicted nucleotidyltransferase